MKRAAEPMYTHVWQTFTNERAELGRYGPELARRYGVEAAVLLVAKMFRSVVKLGGCDFMDNVRVCDIADPADVARYERHKARGCCGHFDGKLRIKHLGRTFRYGFNWGH